MFTSPWTNTSSRFLYFTSQQPTNPSLSFENLGLMVDTFEAVSLHIIVTQHSGKVEQEGAVSGLSHIPYQQSQTCPGMVGHKLSADIWEIFSPNCLEDSYN